MGRPASRARALLRAERAATLERMHDIGRNVDAIVESTRDVATDDEHDPEGQTIAFERAQLLALWSQSREQIERIDEALERIDADAYGVCERCGDVMSTERLEVRPAATTCVACASQEKGQRKDQ